MREIERLTNSIIKHDAQFYSRQSDTNISNIVSFVADTIEESIKQLIDCGYEIVQVVEYDRQGLESLRITFMKDNIFYEFYHLIDNNVDDYVPIEFSEAFNIKYLKSLDEPREVDTLMFTLLNK